jgi:hypothetical protein
MLFLLIVACLAAYYIESSSILTGAIITASISFLVLILLLLTLKKVDFESNQITVSFLLSRKKRSIDYSSVKQIEHLFGYPIFSRNTIVYTDRSGQTKKLTINAVVATGGYLEFVKWMKRKNASVEFTFLPSDSQLKEQFNKVYR